MNELLTHASDTYSTTSDFRGELIGSIDAPNVAGSIEAKKKRRFLNFKVTKCCTIQKLTLNLQRNFYKENFTNKNSIEIIFLSDIGLSSLSKFGAFKEKLLK